MRITKVYTRTGDQGQTKLVGGKEVPKDHPRVDAYGTVDELNTIIGLVRTFIGQEVDRKTLTEHLDPMLHRIQNDLFNIGSDLATPPESRWENMVCVDAQSVKRLESWIDQLNDHLQPLPEFVLPGGGPVGAFLHQARTVCRRAERIVVSLGRKEPKVHSTSVQYLNRLSDWCFVASRWANQTAKQPEHLWEKPTIS